MTPVTPPSSPRRGTRGRINTASRTSSRTDSRGSTNSISSTNSSSSIESISSSDSAASMVLSDRSVSSRASTVSTEPPTSRATRASSISPALSVRTDSSMSTAESVSSGSARSVSTASSYSSASSRQSSRNYNKNNNNKNKHKDNKDNRSSSKSASPGADIQVDMKLYSGTRTRHAVEYESIRGMKVNIGDADLPFTDGVCGTKIAPSHRGHTPPYPVVNQTREQWTENCSRHLQETTKKNLPQLRSLARHQEHFPDQHIPLLHHRAQGCEVNLDNKLLPLPPKTPLMEHRQPRRKPRRKKAVMPVRHTTEEPTRVTVRLQPVLLGGEIPVIDKTDRINSNVPQRRTMRFDMAHLEQHKMAEMQDFYQCSIPKHHYMPALGLRLPVVRGSGMPVSRHEQFSSANYQVLPPINKRETSKLEMLSGGHSDLNMASIKSSGRRTKINVSRPNRF